VSPIRTSPANFGLGTLATLSLLCARDATAQGVTDSPSCVTTPAEVAIREARIDSWATRLAAIDVKNVVTRETTRLRLYAPTGAVDDGARDEFERVAATDNEKHVLSERLEQLVFKAAYHFGGVRVAIVSGWRQHAGRHTSGEALDFKLDGVYAGRLAAYLRGLPRVGVGIYTNPRTQFVHLDVRDQSYHWIDASPPGVKWHERQLHDAHADKRDAAWTPQGDLPL
jgi:uncharacterized protein YcbK (DUF882 family)